MLAERIIIDESGNAVATTYDDYGNILSHDVLDSESVAALLGKRRKGRYSSEEQQEALDSLTRRFRRAWQRGDVAALRRLAKSGRAQQIAVVVDGEETTFADFVVKETKALQEHQQAFVNQGMEGKIQYLESQGVDTDELTLDQIDARIGQDTGNTFDQMADAAGIDVDIPKSSELVNQGLGEKIAYLESRGVDTDELSLDEIETKVRQEEGREKAADTARTVAAGFDIEDGPLDRAEITAGDDLHQRLIEEQRLTDLLAEAEIAEQQDAIREYGDEVEEHQRAVAVATDRTQSNQADERADAEERFFQDLSTADLGDSEVLDKPVYINGQESGTIGELISSVVGAEGQRRGRTEAQRERNLQRDRERALGALKGEFEKGSLSLNPTEGITGRNVYEYDRVRPQRHRETDAAYEAYLNRRERGIQEAATEGKLLVEKEAPSAHVIGETVVPFYGAIRAGMEASNPEGPGGILSTPGERRRVLTETAMTGLDVAPLPVGAAAKVATRTGRTLLPSQIRLPSVGGGKAAFDLPGGFVPEATPAEHIARLRIPRGPEGERISEEVFNQIASTGQYRGIIGESEVAFRDSPLVSAFRRANPDTDLYFSATPSGDIISAGPIARDKPDLGAAEQYFFVSQDVNPNFMESAAFGGGGSRPAIHVYTPEDIAAVGSDLTRVTEADGTIKYYRGGYELERGIPSGQQIPASEALSAAGSNRGRMFGSASVQAPTFAQRSRANIESFLPGASRRGQFQVRRAGQDAIEARLDDVARRAGDDFDRSLGGPSGRSPDDIAGARREAIDRARADERAKMKAEQELIDDAVRQLDTEPPRGRSRRGVSRVERAPSGGAVIHQGRDIETRDRDEDSRDSARDTVIDNRTLDREVDTGDGTARSFDGTGEPGRADARADGDAVARIMDSTAPPEDRIPARAEDDSISRLLGLGTEGGRTPPPPTEGGRTPPPPTEGGRTPPPPTEGGRTPPPPTEGGRTPPPPTDSGRTSPPPTDSRRTPPPPTDSRRTPPPPTDSRRTPPPPTDEGGGGGSGYTPRKRNLPDSDLDEEVAEGIEGEYVRVVELPVSGTMQLDLATGEEKFVPDRPLNEGDIQVVATDDEPHLATSHEVGAGEIGTNLAGELTVEGVAERRTGRVSPTTRSQRLDTLEGLDEEDNPFPDLTPLPSGELPKVESASGGRPKSSGGRRNKAGGGRPPKGGAGRKRRQPNLMRPMARRR